MADDYTPTTEEVEARYISTRSPRFSRKGFRRWLAETLAAHDAEKRAEWEAEQGEPEWEYAWNWSSHPYRDPMPLEGDAPERAAYLADIEQRIAPTVMFRRTREVPAGPWLPVPDTTSESREEADDHAPHWGVIMADNILVAQGYCWCTDPHSGPHRIGVKSAPVPDTTNHESEGKA